METDDQKRERKREQNRRSQKISRERQAVRIKELEERIQLLESATEEDQLANYARIIEENGKLRITLGAWKRSILTLVDNAEHLVNKEEIDLLLHLSPAALTPDSATFVQRKRVSTDEDACSEFSRQTEQNRPVGLYGCNLVEGNLATMVTAQSMTPSRPQPATKDTLVLASSPFRSTRPFDCVAAAQAVDNLYLRDPHTETQEAWILSTEKSFRTTMQTLANAPAPKGWGAKNQAEYTRHVQLCMSDRLAWAWHEVRLKTLQPYIDWSLALRCLGLADAHTTLMRFRLFPCEENWAKMTMVQFRPTALQLAKPVHHTFIDYIYWPELRDCLLLHPPAIGYERAILQSFGLLLCEIPGHNMSISILECFESIRNMQGHEGKRADELSEVEILQLQEALTVWNIFQMENWKLAPYFFEVYPEAREIGSLQSSFPFFTLAEAKTRFFV